MISHHINEQAAAYTVGHEGNLQKIPYIDLLRALHLFNAAEFYRITTEDKKRPYADILYAIAAEKRPKLMTSAAHYLNQSDIQIGDMCTITQPDGSLFMFCDYTRPDQNFVKSPHLSYSVMVSGVKTPNVFDLHFFLCGKTALDHGQLAFSAFEMMFKNEQNQIQHIRGEGITEQVLHSGLCYAHDVIHRLSDCAAHSPADSSRFFHASPTALKDHITRITAKPYDTGRQLNFA